MHFNLTASILLQSVKHFCTYGLKNFLHLPIACSGFHALKFAVSGVIATGVAIGSAIFYAGRNDKIRDDFENKVPFVKPVLSSIYGEREAPVVESEVVGDEFESLLPLKKSGDFINEVTESVLTEVGVLTYFQVAIWLQKFK